MGVGACLYFAVISYTDWHMYHIRNMGEMSSVQVGLVQWNISKPNPPWH